MDCTFEERKSQLEAECSVSGGDFDGAMDRVQEFMLPFIDSFSRQGQGEFATQFVTGLCSDLESKNAESIAYHFNRERGTMQHFVGQSQWDDSPLRNELARQIASQLGQDDGIIILDPSSFPKSGKQSVGVARQWCGRLGKIENCQVGLYLAYASRVGHALVDVELYLPQAWTSDKSRMARVGVPLIKRKYKTRHEIYLEMLTRLGSVLPHQWITGDDELGRPLEFRRKIQAMKEKYMFAVPCNTNIFVIEDESTELTTEHASSPRTAIHISRWAATLAADQWVQVDVRDTEKGPLQIEIAKCLVETGHKHRAGVAREIAIAIRYIDRDLGIAKQDYYLSNGTTSTTSAEFARVAKAEHRIEECLKQGKGQAGLGDYEVRNWLGWHHHQTLSLLACFFLNVETRRMEKKIASDYTPASESRYRFNHPSRIRMRFTPRRDREDSKAIDEKSARQTLSLA